MMIIYSAYILSLNVSDPDSDVCDHAQDSLAFIHSYCSLWVFLKSKL